MHSVHGLFAQNTDKSRVLSQQSTNEDLQGYSNVNINSDLFANMQVLIRFYY
ncbi:hypothetical protein VPR01S_02_03330 [Vibrio proteolyticus NBRC 13287]|uniref:Uncharacterized protein n=1 Tax=Vibrio proteolyticus NBRC 13287 TaxID=1219065 RepID=U2ZYA4_VIBPR|nr:hypothetical protein VPR01S_02_03330 [Vibrio proteolyticus NBRC 13287]